MIYMSYQVKIRNNQTGEVRDYEMKDCEYEPQEDGLGGGYWFWTDGNFGCDCNRELLFDRTKDADEDIDKYQCSEGRFSVLLPGEKEWV